MGLTRASGYLRRLEVEETNRGNLAAYLEPMHVEEANRPNLAGNLGSFWDDAVNAVASVFSAPSQAANKIGLTSSLDRWAKPLTDWEEEHSQGIFTAFAGAAGFAVGGPAGSVAFTSAVSAAYEVGGGIQKGNLSAATMVDATGKVAGAGNFQIDTSEASALNIDTSQLEDLQSAYGQAQGVAAQYGVSLPTVQELVQAGKAKIVDAAGNLIGGNPDAEYSITFGPVHVSNLYSRADQILPQTSVFNFSNQAAVSLLDELNAQDIQAANPGIGPGDVVGEAPVAPTGGTDMGVKVVLFLIGATMFAFWASRKG